MTRKIICTRLAMSQQFVSIVTPTANHAALNPLWNVTPRAQGSPQVIGGLDRPISGRATAKLLTPNSSTLVATSLVSACFTSTGKHGLFIDRISPQDAVDIKRGKRLFLPGHRRRRSVLRSTPTGANQPRLTLILVLSVASRVVLPGFFSSLSNF